MSSQACVTVKAVENDADTEFASIEKPIPIEKPIEPTQIKIPELSLTSSKHLPLIAISLAAIIFGLMIVKK